MRKRKNRRANKRGGTASYLDDRTIVINATAKELELARRGEIGLERIKTTPEYTVFRIKRN